ncbi:hypothetical protein KO527_05135 [Pseudoalteromonas sp. C2R02]|uniref:hypothetical protein n=1 Tax=Pseudoalteromonas sp. C2R02 TaxID=2841565 RepID=UPI001C081D41|nr:hypothetical protein [Pseudoalteromonas sp. C2R02]MBU2968731.1 hypothetical protein [Pseudoalteromonas sp. C2R02]
MSNVDEKAQHREFKKQQLLNQKGINTQEAVKPQKCLAISCDKGVFRGLTENTACQSCYGTGFNTDNPEAVMEYQANLIRRASEVVRKLQAEQQSLINLVGKETIKALKLEKSMRGDDLKGSVE